MKDFRQKIISKLEEIEEKMSLNAKELSKFPSQMLKAYNKLSSKSDISRILNDSSLNESACEEKIKSIFKKTLQDNIKIQNKL